MGVVNTLSTDITNKDAAAQVLSHRVYGGHREEVNINNVAVAAADDDTSTFRVARLRSGDIITSIQVLNDALTSGTDYDLGLYQTAANGGAVVDADRIADGVDMSSARVVWTEVRFNDTTTAPIEEFYKPLWELLGLTEDPHREYDLVWTANTIGSAAGNIVTKVVRVGG